MVNIFTVSLFNRYPVVRYNAPNQCGLVAIFDWNYNVEVIGAERSRGQVYSYYTYQLLTSATAHANELNPCFSIEVGMNFSAVVISASFLSLEREASSTASHMALARACGFLRGLCSNQWCYRRR